MTNRWDPEVTVSQEVAINEIRAQFPELAAKSVQLLGAGWDNTAFLVNDRYIFRFPRREVAVKLLETELNLLKELAPKLPLHIPLPRWFGKPSAEFPWPFLGYEKLEGMTACKADLSEEERILIIPTLANFLKTLHGMETKNLELEKDTLDRTLAQRLKGKILKNCEELEGLGMIKKKDVEPFLERSFRPPQFTALVHGDFYVRHLIVDEKKTLTGVIDWGDIHFGDVACDLMIAHNFLPKRAHSEFRKHYGKISEETWELAKLRALHHSTILILYGTAQRDVDIVREGFFSLAQILD